MSPDKILRVLHFIGGVLWMGGTIACALLAFHGASKQTSAAARKVALSVGTPGMLLAFIGGLGMLIPAFTSYYAKQGWMHGKLTLVLVAAGISGMISGALRKAAESEAQPTQKLKNLGIALVVVLVLIVSLAVLKPGLRA